MAYKEVLSKLGHRASQASVHRTSRTGQLKALKKTSESHFSLKTSQFAGFYVSF